MTLRAIVQLVLAIALVAGAWIGYEKWQDHRRENRAVVEAHADTTKKQIDQTIPHEAKVDTVLTTIIKQGKPPAPTVVYLHDTVPGSQRDSTAYVPKVAYDTLAARFDRLAQASLAFRDTSRTLIDKLIAYGADEKYLATHPKPRRNLGLGFSAGYGAVLTGGAIKTGPSVNVGVSYSF